MDDEKSPEGKYLYVNTAPLTLPGCALFRCDEGSASLATLQQSSSSWETGHSSPPAASD